MKWYLFLLLALYFVSCNKEDFLDAKPDQALIVPQSLDDLQAILDNDAQMNGFPGGQGLVPHLGETGADNYYLLDETYNGTITDPLFKNLYRWDQNLVFSEQLFDWNRPYICILYANIVLEALEKLDVSPSDRRRAEQIGATAKFYRAHAYYQLAQVFAAPYDLASGTATLGLPLRVTADINESLSRENLEDTYQLILNDLIGSIEALPTIVDVKMQPTKQAAYGLLARTYQTMGDYGSALLYAESCLDLQNNLFDYNMLNADAAYPFLNSGIDEEIIFSSTMIGQNNQIPINVFRAKIDSVLYDSYENGDLRKHIFFMQASPSGMRFKGSYHGHAHNFAGLAVDEIYLIKAESLARSGKTGEAMATLNALLETRWDSDEVFVPLQADNAEIALDIVLQERRKELVFRGLRWTDIRRLNSEGRNIVLARNLNGEVLELSPNDARYTYPIPEIVMGFNPEYEQNIR